MTGSSQDGRSGRRRVPLRTSVLIRGVGYGHVSGVFGGALVGAAPGVLGGDPIWIVPGALFGLVVGAVVGLFGGLVGGVAFALAVPCLARHPRAARPAGAAVLPGSVVLLWAIIAPWSAAGGGGLFPDAGTMWFVAVISAAGVVAGALVGPRVLHGKQPPGPPRYGGEKGADSRR